MSFSVNRDIKATSLIVPTMETGSMTANPDGTTFVGVITTSGNPPVRLGQFITNMDLVIPPGSPPAPPPYEYTFNTDDSGSLLTSGLFILSGTLEADTLLEPVYKVTLLSSSIKASAIANLDARGELTNNEVTIADNVQSISPPSGPIFTNPAGEISINITPTTTSSGSRNFTLYVNLTNTQ